MYRRIIKFLAWLLFVVLVFTVLLREGVGLWGDIDYAVNEYQRLGGLGAMMEFILQPPPGATLGALLLIGSLFVCLNWRRLSRSLLGGRRDNNDDAAVLREQRLQHKQDQAERGLRGPGAQSPETTRRVAIKVGGLKDSTISDNIVVGADLLDAGDVSGSEISGNIQFGGQGGSKNRVALEKAVIEAWEKIRLLPEFSVPPTHSPEYETLRDYYERDPSKLPGIVAQIIFNNADPPIPIEGIAPPRTASEVIPKEKAEGYRFSDDATEIFDIFDTDKPPEARRRYVNLLVRQEDIDRRVRAIKERNVSR